MFKVGDVVILKSGGPDMTISTVSDDGVHCIWFKDDNQINGFFPADAVEISNTEILVS